MPQTQCEWLLTKSLSPYKTSRVRSPLSAFVCIHIFQLPIKKKYSTLSSAHSSQSFLDLRPQIFHIPAIKQFECHRNHTVYHSNFSTFWVVKSKSRERSKYLPIIYLIANLLPNDDVNPNEHSVQAMATVLAGPLPRDAASGCPGDPPA